MNPLKIVCHTPDTVTGWDEFIADSPGGSVFSRLPWMQTYAELFQRSLTLFCVEGSDGIQAAIPLFHRKRGFLDIATAPALTLCNGLLARKTFMEADDETSRRAMVALIRDVEQKHHFVSLLLPPSAQLLDIFDHRGWDITPQHNFILPLGDMEKAWNNFNPNLRRKIRRSEEQEWIFQQTDDVDILLTLHKLSYERQHLLPPLPVEKLRSWLLKLQERSSVSIFVAQDSTGLVHAARAIIEDFPVVYDWLAGANIYSQRNTISHWLVYRILLHFHEKGYATFDFMGANTPGIIDFKRQFSCELTEYSIVTYYRSRMVRYIEALNNRSRKRARGFV